MKALHTQFKFLLVFALFIVSSVFNTAAQDTQFSRTCTGTNPLIRQAKVEVTRLGDVNIVPCATRSVLVNGSALSGLGTVQSVGLALPSIFNVTISPITSSGNLTATLASQPANSFFAAPNGVIGSPVFRFIVSADIPALDVSKITTGTFAASFIPSLDATKINTGVFSTGRIPALDASIIATGAFATARLPALDVSQITTGTFAASFIPALDAAKITTGIIAPARLGTGTANATTFLRGDGSYAVASTWGSIAGTLSNQTDLQAALNLKANNASPTFTGTLTAPTISATSITSTTIAAPTAVVGMQYQENPATNTTFSSSDTNKFVYAFTDNAQYILANTAAAGTVITFRSSPTSGGITVKTQNAGSLFFSVGTYTNAVLGSGASVTVISRGQFGSWFVLATTGTITFT